RCHLTAAPNVWCLYCDATAVAGDGDQVARSIDRLDGVGRAAGDGEEELFARSQAIRAWSNVATWCSPLPSPLAMKSDYKRVTCAASSRRATVSSTANARF